MTRQATRLDAMDVGEIDDITDISPTLLRKGESPMAIDYSRRKPPPDAK